MNRSRSALTLLLVFVVASWQVRPVAAQEKPARNLLDDFDPEKHGVAGDWTRLKEGITVPAKVGNRCVVPAEVGENYRLRVEFTRRTGDNVVAILIPVGEVTAVVELSGWNGVVHGLARVEGRTSRDPANPAAVRPGRLENGRRYSAEVDVGRKGDTATIAVELDGKKLFRWSGSTSQLSPHFVFKLSDTKSVGLGVGDVDVVFHSVRLVDVDAQKPSSPPETAVRLVPGRTTRVDLSELGDPEESNTWELFNGARFETLRREDGGFVVDARSSVGRGDRGAFLTGVEFENGTIAVDLKGSDGPQSSFLGVVFAGVDGKTYEAVYFRPFNFGSRDATRRGHAVQYIAHPDWPWDRLRKERTGEFEQAVSPEPKPLDRFRARVEIAAERVRVFVDEAEKPSLDVPRLAERKRGKIGVWFNGIAEFSNMTLTPAK